MPSRRPSPTCCARRPRTRSEPTMPTVLLVEDDPNHAELIRRNLHEVDCRVVPVDDGAGAVEAAIQVRPDLILLDLRLGPLSIDGWEVNRRLKADPRTAAIPVIALSAHKFFGRASD